jgi:hypothetical protein
MTVEEFSNQFDLAIEGYDLEINEYDKSVYLTQAQENICRALYSNQATGDGFESDEKMRRYIDNLVTEQSLELRGINLMIEKKDNGYLAVEADIPKDLWFVVYESAISEKNLNNEIIVVPVRVDDYWRTMRNPFKRPNHNKALRIDNGNGTFKLVSKDPLNKYVVKYLKRPNPIILIDLPDGLLIRDKNKQNTCELNTALHSLILDAAVKLFLSTRVKQSSDV